MKFFSNNHCFSIELGVENGSDSVLKRFCKKATKEENKKAIEMIREQGIHVSIDYILFDPETTIAELKENLQFMYDTNLIGYYPPLILIVYNRIQAQDFITSMGIFKMKIIL